MIEKTDAVVVGAGLAGLVAATELADAGRSVLVVDQEPQQNLTGTDRSRGRSSAAVSSPAGAPGVRRPLPS